MNLFYTKNNLKKLHRSVEVKFKIKFGNPKNEACFTILNYLNFFNFLIFLICVWGRQKGILHILKKSHGTALVGLKSSIVKHSNSHRLTCVGINNKTFQELSMDVSLNKSHLNGRTLLAIRWQTLGFCASSGHSIPWKAPSVTLSAGFSVAIAVAAVNFHGSETIKAEIIRFPTG